MINVPSHRYYLKGVWSFCLLLQEMTFQYIREIPCKTPQSLTISIISLSLSKFPFSWYIASTYATAFSNTFEDLWYMFVCCCRRWHLNISEIACVVHNFPFPWPSPILYLCRKWNNFKTPIFLICCSNRYATAFTYRCQYLMKLNSLDKRRCFRTSNIYSMFYQHIHINQIYLTDTLLNLYPN